jgi:hypothetical protein
MRRTSSQAKRKAEQLAQAAVDEGALPAVLAVAYAILELAFQVGRVADYMTITAAGPPEEQ